MAKRPKRPVGNSVATPIRTALQSKSSLHVLVQDGLGAIKTAHRPYFDESIRECFADSLDVDEAFRLGKEQENRWDYLLGMKEVSHLVGVEPHSAKQDEISTVIRKMKATREHLRDHLKNGTVIYKWIWVASGKIHFINIDKESLRLSQNGILFVGRTIKSKHLK